MLRLFTVFSFGNSLCFFLFGGSVQALLIIIVPSFLFLGSTLWLLLPCQMERRAKGTSKFNQAFPHLHLFVIFCW